jgi:hypothetical protein
MPATTARAAAIFHDLGGVHREMVVQTDGRQPDPGELPSPT